MALHTRRSRKGVTAVEILAVVGVLVILLSMGFLLYRNMRQTARITAAESRLKQISTAMELYFRHNSCYPPQGSDLTVELAPFVDDLSIFENPLIEEVTLGETVNMLYQEPDLEEIDGSGTFLTAMIGEDGTSGVILQTGPRLVHGNVDISDGMALSGRININPKNRKRFRFGLRTPFGLITRKHLTRGIFPDGAGGTTDRYDGPATWLRVRPKGDGDQNELTANGVTYPVDNGKLYTIKPANDGIQSTSSTSHSLTVHLYQDEAGLGDWWIEISSATAVIVSVE